MDYYQILGLSKNASADEIKAAYRRLALAYHPDRNNGNKGLEDRFKLISCAYAYLSNPLQKIEYDQNSDLGNNDKLINIEEIMRKFREDIQLPLWLKLGINENVIKQAETIHKNGWQECIDLSEGGTVESSINSNNYAFFRLNFDGTLSNEIILRAISSKPEHFKIVLFDNNEVVGICKPTVQKTRLEAVHIPWKHAVFCSLSEDYVPDKHYIQDSFEMHNGMVVCVYCEDWIQSVNFKISLKKMEIEIIKELQKIDKFLAKNEMDLKELEKTSKKSGQRNDNNKLNVDKEWEECKNNLKKCIAYNGLNLTFKESTDGKLKLYCPLEEEKGNKQGWFFSRLFGSGEAKKRKMELQEIDIQADKINGVPKMILNSEMSIEGSLQLNEAHCFLMNLRETAVRFESKDGRDFKIWVYNSAGQLIHTETAKFSTLRRDVTITHYPSKICDTTNMCVTICITNVDYIPFPYTLYTANISQIIKNSSHRQSSLSHPVPSSKAMEISKLIQRRIAIYDMIAPL